MPKVRKAHVAAPWTLGAHPLANPAATAGNADSGQGKPKSAVTGAGHGGRAIPELSGQPSNGTQPSQKGDATDRLLPSGQIAAPHEGAVAVDVVTIASTPTDTGSANSSNGEEGFDAVEAVSEMATSHDPAETAAHLALQALETLRSKPGPKQRVLPKARTSGKAHR